ncbi:hypothetical protein K435DRAFT_810860 [Dendrothele bispora CBS 962.96]|uniref:Myb/SANT-like domain-containing protein n=1 Tax=Dendrothele bispora (strain CBS 962.96) TaxID=1314807 RepID=A0A4S8KTW5_DENBC|nr:hypothetical protein K435DRAFT_810860 [Dendrothele bispora CBS 962.96]
MSAPAQDTPAEDPLQSPPQSPIISDPTNRPGLEEIWSSDVDTFITTYLAKVKKDKGLKRNTFTVPIWKALREELIDQGHRSFTHNELKDRFKILKAQAPQSTSTPTPSIPSTPAPPSSTSASSLLNGDRATWNADAESHLIAFLVQAKERGLLSENNFKSKVYTEAASSLAIKGHNATSKQVKSRWTRFKAEFKIVRKLRTLSGFGWDNCLGCIPSRSPESSSIPPTTLPPL